MNPLRLLRNLLADVLLRTTGTWFGAPKDPPWEQTEDWRR